jgi:hypothetical protein
MWYGHLVAFELLERSSVFGLENNITSFFAAETSGTSDYPFVCRPHQYHKWLHRTAKRAFFVCILRPIPVRGTCVICIHTLEIWRAEYNFLCAAFCVIILTTTVRLMSITHVSLFFVAFIQNKMCFNQYSVSGESVVLTITKLLFHSRQMQKTFL